MIIKNTIILFSFISLISLSSATAQEPDHHCNELSLIYEDALNYFNTFKGEEKMKQTLYGSTLYNDYNIDLWSAKGVELTQKPDFGVNQLEYIYVESKFLADAEHGYTWLVDRFESCMPQAYIKTAGNDKNYLQKVNYIDERDKDSFIGFYDWPEFQITLSNVSDVYVVKLRILSKKIN